MLKMCRIGAMAVVLLLGGLSLATAATLAEKVREFNFANGLTLLVVERHDVPTISAYMTIGIGSVDETSAERGVAHLLEHMLFKGTKTLGTTDYAREKPLLEKIEAIGEQLDRLRRDPRSDPQKVAALADQLSQLQREHKQYVVKDEFSRIYAENGGVGYNAFTSTDLTTYMISLPSNKIELWAAIESDRMKQPVLREFYTERDVILEERRRSYESNPERLLYSTLVNSAYAMHPYGQPIIGWESDVRGLTPEKTRNFLRHYYAPINTVIALVGDIEAEYARALVDDYFGTILSGTAIPPVAALEPQQRGEKRVNVRFDAEPQVKIAFHKETLPAVEDYVFDLIDAILSQGRLSRLYQALVLEQQLVTSVATYGAPGSRYPNLFVISAAPRYPHTAAEVETAIYRELQRLKEELVPAAELERVKRRLEVDQLRHLQSNSGLARLLTSYQTIGGDWRYLVDYDQRLAEITAEQIRDVARQRLTVENRTVATLVKVAGEKE
ncbi:MAG: pitrilysin family protein [Desulfuromonadales bacterium]|nr:pitrilysin family protein [Desulfuromonadales bacterium]